MEGKVLMSQKQINLKLNIKNDNGYTIEFCCGEKQYVLGPDEEIPIEVKDEDYMYFDVVR